jgi:hypothetical protein
VQRRGSVRIARPREVVFDTVADERDVDDPNVRHVELLPSEPIGAGSRFRSEVAGICGTVTVQPHEPPSAGRAATTEPGPTS